MTKESEIQRWMEEFFRDPIPDPITNKISPKPDFFDALDFMTDPAGQTLKYTNLIFGSGHALKDDDFRLHRHVREAARVLNGLIEPKLLIADKDISTIKGQILRPDLVLQDPASGAFIIIEIKRNKKTAREFATELLAYVNVLIEQHGASQIFLVQVSTTWSSLEKQAFAKLAKKNFPILPLEFIEGCSGSSGWRLKVRSDLIPRNNIKTIPENSLHILTKTFHISPDLLKSEIARNCIKHAVSCLIHDAGKIGTSGFVMVWHESEFLLDDRDYTIRLFVSMAVKSAPSFIIQSTDPLYDDTPTRLLQEFNIGLELDENFTESEPSWTQFLDRITDGKYYIYDFDSYGDIADQINWYRSYERYSMLEIVPDLTFLPSWHPMTWLIALDLIIEPIQESNILESVQAYNNGRQLSSLLNDNPFKLRDRCNLKRALSHVRFAQTWLRHFSSPGNEKRGSIYRTYGYLWIDTEYVNTLVNQAKEIIRAKGKHIYLCFLMGCIAEYDYFYAPHVIDLYEEVKSMGLELPDYIESEIIKLESVMNTPSMSPTLNFGLRRSDI